MWRNYKTYLDHSTEARKLMREAFFLLMWFRVATLVMKFKYLTRSLKHSAEAIEPPHLQVQSLCLAAQIGKIVARVGAHTPWESPCLTQVLVVQHMLARRCIPGVFYLGVRKEKKDQSTISTLDAHAWLRCDTKVVNGGEGHEAFIVVSCWSWP